LDKIHANKRRWAFFVSGVIALRVAAAGLFLYAFVNNLRTWAICLFLVACFTDALDGHLARKLGISPYLGAYFDATADFLLVLAAFSAFVVKGLYPFWILLLIGAMFTQFVVTSGPKRPLYDPLGKYYGVFLFAAIGVTLLFPRPDVYEALLLGTLGFTVGSVVSRSVFLLHHKRRTSQRVNEVTSGSLTQYSLTRHSLP
jgi:CDP-diacylglycerol--glycerol-3-phosphate 3-phosphatidyltransferase